MEGFLTNSYDFWEMLRDLFLVGLRSGLNEHYANSSLLFYLYYARIFALVNSYFYTPLSYMLVGLVIFGERFLYFGEWALSGGLGDRSKDTFLVCFGRLGWCFLKRRDLAGTGSEISANGVRRKAWRGFAALVSGGTVSSIWERDWRRKSWRVVGALDLGRTTLRTVWVMVGRLVAGFTGFAFTCLNFSWIMISVVVCGMKL